MKFSEVQLNVAADQAIAGIQRHVPAISLFARSFNGRAGEQYNGVAVPAFANLSGATVSDANNITADIWCNGEELQAAVVSLEKNISKVYALTDYEAAATDNLYLADAYRAIADQVTEEAVKYVMQTVLADANLSAAAGADVSTLTASAPTAKAGFAGLFNVANEHGINPYDTVAVLDPLTFSALLSSMGDSYVYGGPELARSGVVENLYGFKGVVACPQLASGTKGFLIPWNTLGVVSRWDRPAIDGYTFTDTVTDPKTGFTVGFRGFEHLCRGKAYIGGNVLFGAKILQKGIVKLV